MRHVLFAAVAFAGSSFARPANAAPDQQEDACASPQVIACDNFESRASGTLDLSSSRFKSPGWSVNGFFGIASGASPAGGTRVLQTQYGAIDGNADLTIAPGHATLYFRWFTKRSGFKAPSRFARHATFAFGAGLGFLVDHPLAVPEDGASGLGAAFSFPTDSTEGQLMRANMNGPVRFADDTWYCIEARISLNSAPTAADGYVQGWVDETQHWDYPDVNLTATAGAPATSFTKFSLSTLFLDPFVATMPRAHDNVVISTSRIGCAASSTDGGAPGDGDGGADASTADGSTPKGPGASTERAEELPGAPAKPQAAANSGSSEGCSLVDGASASSAATAGIAMVVAASVLRRRRRARSGS